MAEESTASKRAAPAEDEAAPGPTNGVAGTDAKPAEEGTAPRARKRRSGWDRAPVDVNDARAAAMAKAAAFAQAAGAAGAGRTGYHTGGPSPSRLYIGNLHFAMAEQDVRAMFAPFGPIKHIEMPREPSSGKSKGFCFVEYEETVPAQQALNEMKGMVVLGREMKIGRPSNVDEKTVTIEVEPAPAAKEAAFAAAQQVAGMLMMRQQQQQMMMGMNPMMNPMAAMAGGGGGGGGGGGKQNHNRIYVGSLHFELKEADVKAIFAPFGNIVSVEIVMDSATGKPKGYGFIEFDNPKSAVDAVAKMDGFELAGRNLKVGAAHSTSGGGRAGGGGAMAAVNPQMMMMNPMMAQMQMQQMAARAQQAQAAAAGGAGGAVGGDAAAAAAAAARAVMGQHGESVGSLNAEENMTLKTGADRTALMQRLMRGEEFGSNSNVVLLLNMVEPEEVDDDLQQETQDECSKFGTVKQVVVHQEQQTDGSTIVKVFVEFGDALAAGKACKELDKRWFGGKIISAKPYDMVKFANKQY